MFNCRGGGGGTINIIHLSALFVDKQLWWSTYHLFIVDVNLL